ncbi:hypothetical protein [Nocardia sp. CA-119907]|uniref:hypothetical protein n=1 Tax=Nocardia sp. CA-119907 TaxID=3239973 RepID=UPI003D96F0B2
MNFAANSSEFDDLYPALGRLVVNSSFMEGCLRNFVHWLALSDDAWILFAGQSVDWLIQSGKAMLGELDGADEFNLQNIERFQAALGRAKALNEHRNHLVHGDWRLQYRDDYEPRPRNSPADNRVFFVARSRLRRDASVRQVAVVDIELLADQMRELGEEIEAATQEGARVRYSWNNLRNRPSEGFVDWDPVVMLDALARKHGVKRRSSRFTELHSGAEDLEDQGDDGQAPRTMPADS